MQANLMRQLKEAVKNKDQFSIEIILTRLVNLGYDIDEIITDYQGE